MLGALFGRRDDEDAKRKAGRLPPGQSLTQRFPVLHYGPVPPFNPETWSLRVFGEVETEVTWTWEQFQQLPRTQVQMDLHCVTRWSKFDTAWEGVALRTLVDQGLLKLKPTARYLLQHAEFGFTVNLPVEVAMQENFLLATHYDGQPITPDHGYPLRGVAGTIRGQRADDKYFWKGGKWLRALEFRANDMPGFWERNGYHNQADVWREQRHSWPGF